MVVLALVPLPVHISPELCKCTDAGKGVAVWQGVLVISSCKELQVFALPRDIARGGVCGPKRELVHVRTLGGAAPMEEFGFYDSGIMAFTEGGLLLVTDRGISFRDVEHGTVHVIDVFRGIHVGYVAARGTMKNLRGVATRKSLAAVSCCGRSTPEVRVFANSATCTWTAVRVIAVAGCCTPFGLRFSADGTRLVVTNFSKSCLSMFCAKHGTFLRHIALVPEGYSV